MICGGADEVEVACAQLIIEGDAFGKMPFVMGYAELYALAYGEIHADAGGESVISGGVAVGFLCPEFIVEDSVHIERAG